jgi:hypothetical protein
MGEASLDESDGSFESLLRSEEQVEVVGHDDEGVELVVAFGSVVLEGFDEEPALRSTWKRRRRL